ncbi:MAG TPA: AsmA-like C-terminal region-containing protein [bacterium]|nr:AsmA-like C-terminal region-containing protein [bacterium]
MEIKTVLLIIFAITAILFVPFYPFRLVKKLILFFFNRFIPLPIKFEDIGGIPIIGMRLYKIQINLGANGSMEAAEMHLKINFWRLLTLRRPSINPLAFHKPVIRVKQIEQKGEIWFLFPLTVIRWVLGILFVNLWGLNVVRMYRGKVIIEGQKGDTVIEDLNGEFTSHGSKMKVKRLSCTVGDGSIEIHYPRSGPMIEGNVTVKNLRIEDLAALKVPKAMTGPVNIEAVMTGSVAETELNGHISSPTLYMRDEPISDFRSPLRFHGTKLILEKMQGRLGEYHLEGYLETDVETDISELRLKGSGKGKASGSILKMLAMQPFIESAEMDADILLEGDLNQLYEFKGDISLILKNAVIDFSEIGEGSMAGFPLQPVPEAHLHLVLDRGKLFFDKCSLKSNNLLIFCNGRIDMEYDPELDEVVRSQFYMKFSAECPDIQDLANILGMDKLDISGSAEAKFSLDCDYSDHFHKLDGSGHLAAKNTTISAVPISNIRTIKSPVNILIDKFDTDFVLEKEAFHLINTTISGKYLNVDAKGRIGFFDKNIGFDGDLSIVPEFISSIKPLKLMPHSSKLMDFLKAGFEFKGKTNDRPKFKLLIPHEIKEIFSISRYLT